MCIYIAIFKKCINGYNENMQPEGETNQIDLHLSELKGGITVIGSHLGVR